MQLFFQVHTHTLAITPCEIGFLVRGCSGKARVLCRAEKQDIHDKHSTDFGSLPRVEDPCRDICILLNIK